MLKIHFPSMDQYIYSNIRFMIPAVIFTVVLLITFVFTIVIIFRQKRYTEIKNDFINNMTHELKTPISSISLAAQMLGDESVTKSPTMMKHLSTVIGDESRRLRFLVEKVLQMSMFDRKSTSFKKKELDLNELLEQTFPLALLFGNEALGISPDALAAADGFVSLPMLGSKASINVGNCAAVVLYAVLRKSREVKS